MTPTTTLNGSALATRTRASAPTGAQFIARVPTRRKAISKRLKKLLRDNGRADIIEVLKKYPNGMDYFDISVTDRAKISYLKGNRIPEKDHLLFNKEYRRNNAFHCKVGKVLSKMEVDARTIQEVSAIFYNNALAGQFEITDEIVYWYNERQYARATDENRGNLYCSCMRNFDEAIEFYEELGRDIVRLLIMRDREGALVGRALLWYGVQYKQPFGGYKNADYAEKYAGKPYMDRIYSANENIEQAFKQYAESKGLPRYGQPCGTMYIDITGRLSRGTCTPYLDTFGGISADLTRLSNISLDAELTSTDGATVGDLVDYYNEDSGYTCDYCGTHLHEEEYYYLDRENAYACDECCVYLDDEDRYGARDNSEYLEYRGTWVRSDRCVYSNLEGRYLHEDDAVCLDTERGDYVHHENTTWSNAQEDDIYTPHTEYSEILGSWVHRDTREELEQAKLEERDERGE